MTSPISSYSQSQGLPDPIGSSNASSTAAPPGASATSSGTSSGTPADAAARSGEAVTITPNAQSSADLLEAARAATGTDQQAVQSLKADILSGSYQVPPDNLAASIVAALAEIRS
jgi:flagellar biosynthesis anti-sigma factor FlgM